MGTGVAMLYGMTNTAASINTAASTPVTREQVIALLDRPAAVERAILALYARQTSDEQVEGTTKYHNAQGFTGGDAKRFSFIAEFLSKGGHMKAETCARYAPRLRKYATQLAKIANAKRAAAAAAQTAVKAPAAVSDAPVGSTVCPRCNTVRCPDGCCCGC